MVGPAFSQSSNNAGKFAFLVSLVSSESASHCKENNINYSNNLLLVRIKNTPCFYFEKNKPGKATNLSDKNCQLHDCKERGQAKVFVAQKLKAVDRLMSPAIRATVGGGPTRVRPERELHKICIVWMMITRYI